MSKVLLVDDDVDFVVDVAGSTSSREGFEADVAHDGETGVAGALSGGYAIVVPRRDDAAPGGSRSQGRRIRAHSQVPVIMLTAKGDDVGSHRRLLARRRLRARPAPRVSWWPAQGDLRRTQTSPRPMLPAVPWWPAPRRCGCRCTPRPVAGERWISPAPIQSLELLARSAGRDQGRACPSRASGDRWRGASTGASTLPCRIRHKLGLRFDGRS